MPKVKSRQTTLTEDFGFPKIQTCLNLFQIIDKNHQVPSQTKSTRVFNHVMKTKRNDD